VNATELRNAHNWLHGFIDSISTAHKRSSKVATVSKLDLSMLRKLQELTTEHLGRENSSEIANRKALLPKKFSVDVLQPNIDIIGGRVDVATHDKPNGPVLHVNVEGLCVLRVCQIEALDMKAARNSKMARAAK
jgi:hypothetical protein